MSRSATFAEVREHFRAAARTIQLPNGRARGSSEGLYGYDDDSRQRWRRLVSAEFLRRLLAAGIYVEGA